MTGAVDGPAAAGGPAAPDPARRGVVALGDSITVGEGEPSQGVRMLGWAQWVALALDVPYHPLARNGALAGEVLADLAPRVRGRHDVAGLHVGTNDVRSDPFDPAAFRATVEALVERCVRHAARTVLVTLPEDLGRPRCAPKPFVANELLREVAAAHGALVVELGDLRGRRFVLPDAVHPTAVGQLEIAQRVLRVLAADGLAVAHDPWRIAEPFPGVRSRLAADRVWLRNLAFDLRRRAVERRAARRA